MKEKPLFFPRVVVEAAGNRQPAVERDWVGGLRARHELAQLVERGIHGRLRASVHDHARAFTRERDRNGVADALRRSGHECELVADLQIHRCSFQELCE